MILNIEGEQAWLQQVQKTPLGQKTNLRVLLLKAQCIGIGKKELEYILLRGWGSFLDNHNLSHPSHPSHQPKDNRDKHKVGSVWLERA